MKYASVLILAGSIALAGCVTGPNYQRPAIETPPAFRGTETAARDVSLADTQWPELFNDPVLTDLAAQALTRNPDVRMASERVLQRASASASPSRTGSRPSTWPQGSRPTGTRGPAPPTFCPKAPARTPATPRADSGSVGNSISGAG